MHEYQSQPEFELDELLSRMARDLVFAEGFKKTQSKLEARRASVRPLWQKKIHRSSLWPRL